MAILLAVRVRVMVTVMRSPWGRLSSRSVLLPHLGNIGHDDPDDEDDCLDKAGTQGDDQEDDRDSLLVAHDHGDDEEDDSDREGDHSDLRADKMSRMMTEGLQQEAELVSPG